MEKSPKEHLGDQLKRLRLDQDLRYMADEWLRKMSDEKASEVVEKIKKSPEGMVVLIRQIVEDIKAQ